MTSDKQIFAPVLRVWNQRGLAQTTLKHIGEAAEVTELTLIRRFETRDKLICSAFEDAIDGLQQAIIPSNDLNTDIRRLLEIISPLLRSRGRLVLDLFLDSSRRDDARAMVPAALRLLNRMGVMLAEYQSAGRLRGTEPWVPLLALIGPLFLNSLPRGPDRQSPYVLSTIEEFLNGWSTAKELLD